MKASERFAKSDIVDQKNCLTCHTIGSSGGTVGPRLNQISNRRSAEWLRDWLRDPEALKPNTKMPNFQFSEGELDKVLKYLASMRREVRGEKILAANSDPVEAGKELFEAYDCYACHRIGDQGRFVGPNLTWIGIRKSEAWEKVWLADPPAYKPGTFMPNFQLTPSEIEALAAFLHALRGQENDAARKWESLTSFILDARPRDRGRLVAERLACWSCHGEGLAGGVNHPNAEEDGDVPPLNTVYADYTEDELRDVVLKGSDPSRPASGDALQPFECPPWRDALTDGELTDLLAHLETLIPESARWEFE